jgi:hypothetical protein
VLKKILVSVVVVVSLMITVAVFITARAVYHEKKKIIAECNKRAAEAVKAGTPPLKVVWHVEFIKMEIEKGMVDWDDLDNQYDEKYLDEILDTRKPEYIPIHKSILADLLACRIPDEEKKSKFFMGFERRVKYKIFTWEELGVKEEEFQEAKNRCLGQKI